MRRALFCGLCRDFSRTSCKATSNLCIYNASSTRATTLLKTVPNRWSFSSQSLVDEVLNYTTLVWTGRRVRLSGATSVRGRKKFEHRRRQTWMGDRWGLLETINWPPNCPNINPMDRTEFWRKNGEKIVESLGGNFDPLSLKENCWKRLTAITCVLHYGLSINHSCIQRQSELIMCKINATLWVARMNVYNMLHITSISVAICNRRLVLVQEDAPSKIIWEAQITRLV
jgi:hypothetical protein